MRRMTVLLLAAVFLGGCAVPETPETPVSYRLETDPVEGTEYFIYVPSTYRHDQPMPLVVTCHGTPPYDVAEYHIRAFKWYAEKHGCIVVAPKLMATDGLIGDGPIVGMLNDERFILSIISKLSYRYNIDRANIMITGFSGGGFPTYWVGLRNPDVFSVVVARNCNFSKHNLDGWYPPEAVETPVMVYYGANDPAAIKLQSNAAIKYLRSKGFNVYTEVIPGAGHERHPEYAMEFFEDHMSGSRPTFTRSPRVARR